MNNSRRSAGEVALWMLKEIQRRKFLEQDTAVYDIESKFGREYVYTNDRGNSAISKQVLTEFKKVSGDTVVWDRTERYWRLREVGDDTGRSQS